MKAYAVNVGRKLPARFDAGKWYEVPAVMAKYLATVHEKPGNKLTPLAFDVCKDKVEARELIRREEAAKRAGKKPEDAVDMAAILTTGDLAPVKPAAIMDTDTDTDPDLDLTDPDLGDVDTEEEEPEPPPPPARTRKRKPKPKPKAKPTKRKAKAKGKAKAKPKSKGKKKSKAQSTRKR